MFNPAPMSAPPAMTYPAATYPPRQPAPPASPQPVIRAQAPEEPKPSRPPLLTMPSPEQLGVAVRPVENGIDWSNLHARMKDLGIVNFHMEALPDGRSRFICWLPRDKPGLTQRIESVGDSQAAAVQLALQHAAQPRSTQP